MPKRSSSRLRFFGFRFAAIALGLSPLLLFEFGLILAGWNKENELIDPYIGFSELRPLFVLNDLGSEYEVSPTRYPFFRPERFSAAKSDDEFRVFCLGGSTVQGRPYAIETSFTTWLELSLQAADPTRKWEVVNCGGVSYASYRLVPILDEVMKYEPDLIVLYTGHNEFLEDRTYSAIKRNPAWINALHESASFFKTYRFILSRFAQPETATAHNEARSIMPADVQPELDFKNGLDFYHWDEDWRRGVIEHFDYNLNRMVSITKRAGVPLILVNPIANLKHCAPFKSEHGADVSQQIRDRVATLEESQELRFARPEDELAYIQELLAADDQFAALHFRAGHCLQALERFDEAKQAFINAKERDVCPLRILEPMREIIERSATKHQVPLVDAERYFSESLEDRIPGRETLVDHVHPTVHAHQLIAGLIMDSMLESELFEISNPAWQAERDSTFKKHLQSLGVVYFQRGQDRLRSLQRWAKGQSKVERPDRIPPSG